MDPDCSVFPAWCPGDSFHRTLTSKLVSHETAGPVNIQAHLTLPLGLVIQGDCAPCGAGLSAPAQDSWVLVKSAGYTPRMMEGEFLISPMQCGQGVTINYRVKSRGGNTTQP